MFNPYISYVPMSEEEAKNVKPREILNDHYTWVQGTSMVGSKVVKRSGRPFKSQLKCNTCTGIVRNPHTHLWALTFADDDSIVDVKQLKLES
ncbi:hypothetical protein pEaSNUABM50_00500 [Erwinia phage pEa_SNUABM_50]|uniref:Uncharacterized protein n=3 Tax=Eneladusvirus BF TaxID=2560751 RepID=A0A7L8ZPQ7_9CAUD|nr:hypothetical protein FDH34_gp442 [Serratia phage BF]QOI71468.1 hypothetical protein pEaSNUABM12_00556 [Erwinia phage pEa_SNUABM_12]QOI72495.1 hypothetical protein pEaSNUABM50_00500 [Erwinia phage pEa_SNUABM_50]QXO11623.1 hypothetical protein pEaSNUABM19_00507 [Erwinia phage pEa_SNUABM_19]QXO12171.1 hypothetical protein pEaSNUABM44_00505 [Erwinia phage pEa_SNUABM_44]QXO12727.1 hypothetical protein pEaSNUABM49_00509 [Erwinia phage pEa_SNUABM_49]